MRFRFYSLLVFFSLVIIVWTVYLFSIQIFDPLNLDYYRQIRYKPAKEILIPSRGSILDCRGNLFVSSVAYYQADIDRKQVNQWAKEKKISLVKAYKIISDSFAKNSTLTRDYVFEKLTNNNNLNSIQISNKIKESELELLLQYFDKNKLPGFIYSFSSMKRIYSKGITAARLLGSVKESTADFNPDDPVNSIYKLSGLNGLEATYDKELAGKYGWREVIYDANHNRVPYPNLHEKKPVNGENLWLTIDASIQDVVEESLAEGLQLYGASNAAAVVMDVNTGRIYAMAGVSSEDYSEDPGFVRVKSNIPVSFLFEPGSTMKPFTALTALDSKLVTSLETFPSGSRRIGIREIRDTHNYGPLRIREIISKSSNVGISIIGDRVGSSRLYNKLIALGFGQKTDLNLFGESSGIYHKLEDWDGYSLHSITFGYAISVTAIQLAAAYCVVANGGNYVKPYLIDSIKDETGKVIKSFEPKLVRRVVSQTAADTLKSYLQSVVDDGTAKHIRLNYISMAGKTGTAQKKLVGSSGYAPGKYTGNFVGFFPVEKPEMVVVVVYDEPSPGLHFGGLCAAPTFQKIVEKTLFLPSCSILPKNKRMQQMTTLTPHVIGMTVNNAELILKQNGLSYKVESHDSSNVIVDQYPKPNVSLDRTHPLILVTGKINQIAKDNLKTGIMPDLTGMTLRKALQVSAFNKIKLKIQGMGIIQKQSILAGTRIVSGSTCIVEASL
jgi:cell division protein FtsI/penicillin-binding protein 2